MSCRYKLLNMLCLFLAVGLVHAQDKGVCVLPEINERMLREDPDMAESWQMEKVFLEEETRQYIADDANKMLATYTIPVVVHIVHKNGAENVSDTKVAEAIARVNADFAAQNAVNIHPNFQGLVTNAQMEFVLASCDPNGNPTNGITRTYNPTWSDCGGCDIAMKQTLWWPNEKYLNIYVVSSSDGGNGSAFAYYPSQVQPPWSHYDGVVISSWAFGETTTGYESVLTHEIGHWANLIHVWGNEGTSDQASSCNQDDLVSDTPNTIGHFQANCGTNTTSCGSLDNNENYMDYGYCPKMYTAGQVNRMHAALNSTVASRNNIWSAANLAETLQCGGGGGGGPTELQNGQPVSNQSGGQGDWVHFSIDVPSGASNLQMSISGGSGDADLYTRFGSQPTTNSYDCRPYIGGNNENCSVASPSAGTYYISLRGYSSFSGVTVTASFDTDGGGGGGAPEIHESNLSGAQDQWLHYTLEIPSGQSSATIEIGGGSGDADLYVRYGAQPTLNDWDYRPWVNGNSETVNINNPAAGTWHISIRGYNSFSGLNLDAVSQ